MFSCVLPQRPWTHTSFGHYTLISLSPLPRSCRLCITFHLNNQNDFNYRLQLDSSTGASSANNPCRSRDETGKCDCKPQTNNDHIDILHSALYILCKKSPAWQMETRNATKPHSFYCISPTNSNAPFRAWGGERKFLFYDPMHSAFNTLPSRWCAGAGLKDGVHTYAWCGYCIRIATEATKIERKCLRLNSRCAIGPNEPRTMEQRVSWLICAQH